MISRRVAALSAVLWLALVVPASAQNADSTAVPVDSTSDGGPSIDSTSVDRGAATADTVSVDSTHSSRIPRTGGSSGLRIDTLRASDAQPFQLEPIIIPGTEEVWMDDRRADSTEYRLDYRRAWLWVDSLQAVAHLIVHYRTLPFRLKDTYRLHEVVADQPAANLSVPADSSSRAKSTSVARTASDSTSGAAAASIAGDPSATHQESLFQLGEGSRLQHNGSITRGIFAGNNRDVTIESGLRMQLSGEVADGVNVQAVLTDENTPILPEGTTQRLEEFDRVYIELDAPYGKAQLGDFDLSFSDTEFAPFSRKLQGATAVVEIPRVPGVSGGYVQVAGATARGHFRSQQIQPIDGVQGPYRLEGDQGERFVLVVPGSETVFVDGRPLLRGETNDYTIDYATAEISFTPNVIVTADKRIKVEFQYSTTQFTRTLLGTQAAFGLWPTSEGDPRLRLGASIIREADGRDFSKEFGFTPEDSLAIVRAGDGLAQSRGVEEVPFDPEAVFVQYRRTVHAGDTIYAALDRAPADSESVYRVHFSRVGQGEGDYVRVGRNVNGIVYEHRGRGQGDYLPVRILQKPMQQRVVDLHGAFAPVGGVEVFGEWAQSMNDENRLSPFDTADDLGNAYTAGVRLTGVELGFARVTGEAYRRFVDNNFESFNRIRPVEFERRWNLLARRTTVTGGVVDAGDERIDEGRLEVELFDAASLRAEYGQIELGTGFDGVRRAGYFALAEPGIPQVDYQIEVIGSQDRIVREDGRWLRQLGTVRVPTFGGKLTPRMEVEHERRRQHIMGTDSLARPSFAFVELRPGLDWKSGNLETGAFVEHRRESDWIDGDLRDAATSWTGQTRIAYRPSAKLDVNGSVGYRVRRFRDQFRIQQAREDVESILLQWDADFRPLDRAIQIGWLYKGMTERTPTMQEIYVRTGPEIGQFVWEDANGDGIIQIDEMLPERLPNEGTYIKTFIPSDDLTPVVNVETRVRLELDPKRLFEKPSTPFQRWMSQIATRTVFEVQEKTRDPRVTQIYLLDLGRFRDPVHTMNGRIRFAQDLFLFRDRPDVGIDASFNQARSLTELAAGEESRFLNAWRLEARGRLTEAFGLRARASLEQDRLLSDAFDTRRYDIEGIRFEPEASYAISSRITAVLSGAYGRKDDAIGARRARILKLPVELRYSVPRKLRITARGEVAAVKLQGNAAGLAEYELTDGRGPGTSYLWSLNGQYTINEYLRATFSYDGRAPSKAPVIHTMQLQLSALF